MPNLIAGHALAVPRIAQRLQRHVEADLVAVLEAVGHGLGDARDADGHTIDNKAATPKLDYPPLRLVRFSGAALTEGVEEHVVDGVTVRVTGVAKTVADCFKYRNKIGLDVALEALRDAWNGKRMTSDEIWHYAKIDRVANVMRPYLESLA